MNLEKINHVDEGGESVPKKVGKFEQILGRMPSFAEHMKKMRTNRADESAEQMGEDLEIVRDEELQGIYDEAIENSAEDWEIQNALQDFNVVRSDPFLASGQSSYFSKQIERDGMSGLKIKEQDMEDARYIAECFGKKIGSSEDNLDILYTALPGTVEMNYATQTFPAMIFEDVFQCYADHELPLNPKVGEKEEDYWGRVLEMQIAQKEDFPQEKIEEAKVRGARLVKNFCTGKNRIYLIPIKNVLNNKASFGDIPGVRGGELKSEDTVENAINEQPSLQELAEMYGRDVNNVVDLYGDANFTSEYGVALYGKIPQDGVRYIEVEREYDVLQRKARQAGIKEGEVIGGEV